MSTVADVLDLCSYRINEDADLYSIINLAIRTVARHLKTIESSIVVERFSVPIYGEVEYVSDSIALVAGSPYTITDSDNAFVTEGFVAGMYVETDQDGNEGPYLIDTVAAGTLTIDEDTEETMTAVAEGDDITLTTVDDWGLLPTDFWGMVGERPFIDGETWELEPLPSQRVELAYTSAGEPRYFKIRNNKLYVIPATSSDITVKGDYFKRPTKLTATTDTVPFDELFDELLAEIIVRYYKGGFQGEAGLTELRLFVQEQVDSLVSGRDFKAPTQMPRGGIDWNGL